MKSVSVTIQMKAIQQCFPVVLFSMLFWEVSLTFEAVDEILTSVTISNYESYLAVLSSGLVYYTIQMNATEQYEVVLTFQAVDEILSKK